MPAAKLKKNRRTSAILVRLTPGEMKQIEKAARDLGYDRAQYLRETVIVRTRGVQVFLPPDAKEAIQQMADQIGVWRAMSPDCITDEEMSLLFNKS